MANTEKRLDSNIHVLPVILSGGEGKRLWPLSRASYPKQYLSINENDQFTLIQSTYLRLKKIDNLLSPLIVCNEEQRFVVAEQMRQINVIPDSILLEPFGKNTAPAVALSALMSVEKYNDPILLVLPSDHKIKDIEIFNQNISEGISLASKGSLVTFGIVPKSAETQYGYIESNEKISGTAKSSDIKKFIEKPSKEIAEKLFKNKHYTWNSGIYIFKASQILKELNKYAPSIVEICKKSLEGSKKDLNFQRINSKLFKKCTSISIDIAVMEKTRLGKVIPLNVGWNDLGNWKSVCEDSKKDIHNNKNSFITSTSGANALQVENEEIKETENQLLNSMVDENMAVDNLTTVNIEDKASNHSIVSEERPLNLEETNEAVQNNDENSNGLENFELSEESPQLFNDFHEIENEAKKENLNSESEEDELEIPAFLRRQKN